MNHSENIYLDHAATTPVRAEVFEAMRPFLTDHFGNAGSLHRFGRGAKKAVENARGQVASLIGVDPRDLIFTSGGTEANNLAVQGLSAKGARIIVSAVEHHAVLHAAEIAKKRFDTEVITIPVDSDGQVNVDQCITFLDDNQTALVSVMHGNNETGTIQPVEQIGAICRERGIPLHTDAVQSAGKIPIDIARTPIDLVSLSAHKIYGPKGVGALYVRRDIHLEGQIAGGSQERGRRAGTENVASIVGFGSACELAQREMQSESHRLRGLLDQMEKSVLETVPGSWVNGSRDRRLPHILNIGFPGVEGVTVMLGLDDQGIAVATGSACTSGSVDASHVLLAMGQDHTHAHSGVRFSLGRDTGVEVIQRLCEALSRL